MSDADIIRSQAERISLLEEELRQLREEELRQLRECSKKVSNAYFPIEWCLNPGETRLLAALYESPRRAVRKRDIERAVLARGGSLKTLDVVLCTARRKLAPYGIEITTRWGAGLELPPESRRIISEALVSPL